MRQKYNRNRNTFTVPGGDRYQKSRLGQIIKQSSTSIQHFSGYQKTFLSLKLLQKCSQKMFLFKDQQYFSLIKYQSDCNKFLSTTTIDTISEAINLQKNGKQSTNQYANNLQEIKQKNAEQKLISSWTAFQNLDITYKTKKEDLAKENAELRKRIAYIENKLKAIHLSSSENSFVNLPASSIGVNLASKTSNLQQIESRIQEHGLLVNKLKQKIEKKRQQKIKYKEVYIKLISKAQQQYGQQSVGKIKEMFGKQIEED